MQRLAAALFFAVSAIAQNRPCSFSMAGDNVAVFACSAPELRGRGHDAEAMAAILNKIILNKLDPQAVLTKLDELPESAPAGKRGAASSVQFSDLQKQNLLKLAKMYPGQKVMVLSLKGDSSGAIAAAELVSAFSAADWLQADGSPLTPAEYAATDPPRGIEISVNDRDLSENQLPKSAIPLTISLQAMGLSKTPVADAGVPRGTIQLKIGTVR
jgi:hypothetical protein